MIGLLLLMPMMFFAAAMSMFAGLVAMISMALTLVMGMLTSAVTLCSTALLGALIFILSYFQAKIQMNYTQEPSGVIFSVHQGE